MTEQNENKDGQKQNWDELRQKIWEIEPAPYDTVANEFYERMSTDLKETDLKETDVKSDTKEEVSGHREYNYGHTLHESQKIKKNIVRAAGCAAALLCTVVAMKGVTGMVQGSVVGRQPQKISTNISADVINAMKKIKQKEAKQKKIKKAKQVAVKKNYTVCIDAGHGGKDRGCYGTNRTESTDTLALAEKIQKQLEKDGVSVIMTRDTDVYITLEQRVGIANEAKADYFISIHRNQGDGNGVETWISSQPTDEAKTLGENIHTGITEVGVQRDRGLKMGSQSGSGNYYVIRCSNMPACLVELGFVNNETDNQNFDKLAEEYAKAIAKGIEQTAVAYKHDTAGEAKDVVNEKKERDTETVQITEKTSTAVDTQNTQKRKNMDDLNERKEKTKKYITTDNLKDAE